MTIWVKITIEQNFVCKVFLITEIDSGNKHSHGRIYEYLRLYS